MDRRAFLALTSGAAFAELPRSDAWRYSSPEAGRPVISRSAVLVRAGFTRGPDHNETKTPAQQTVVRSFDSEGRLAAFVVPIGSHEAFRGAPLHLHHEVDEWLFITMGEFVAEVGGRRIRLRQGDSLLMPMKIPHRWSNADSPISGAVHLYTPAGLMDISWDPSPDDNRPSTPEQRKADFEKYGMTLLGAPLTRDEILQTLV